MKFKLIILAIAFFLFSFPCFDFGNAVAKHDDLWSIDFSDLTITKALSRISDMSDVEIVLDGQPSETALTKSYKEMPVVEVLMDLFSDESFAALLNYNNQILTSINIWVFRKSDTKGSRIKLLEQIQDNRNMQAKGSGRKQTTDKVKNTVSNPEQTTSSEITEKTEQDNRKINSSRIISNIGIGHRNKMETEDSLIPEDKAESGDPDDPSTPDSLRFGGLEPPPMPPGMTFNEK